MKILRIVSVLIICAIKTVLSIPNSKVIRKSARKAAQKRSKRYTVLYPWIPFNTCIAFAVVLAIPLQLKGRNVYMSYNFETSFYMPYFDRTQGLVPLPFATIDAPAVNQGTILFYANGGEVRELNGDEDVVNEPSQNETLSVKTKSPVNSTNSTEAEDPITDDSVSFKKSNSTTNSTGKNQKSKQSKKKPKQKKRVNREILSTLLSRKKLYKILEHKLEMAGFNGEECVLKTICETSDNPFAEHNGVLGDILHVIFTPTTSRDEKLPQQYYDAIEDGKSGRCRYYNTLCPKGILDFITKTMQ
ncbi:uncharacterized protein LOC129580378 [Sitodiplosis mosellana]|uniref:uncharacterized protein LOC129580378 n=1 Tax=Sitodiplosis mosellana TaxID=263140 RepID=UPI002443BE89|nr:uncharacterized protein LOC129580378 [Sitodiplosis mosellana]